MSFYDESETRSTDEREADLVRGLSRAVDDAKHTPGMARILRDVDPDAITSLADLTGLPILRRSNLAEAQSKRPPLGGMATRRATEFDHIFQTAGPVYHPGRLEEDWWGIGRFIHASDIGHGDIMHNCFSYHLTPMGMIFESGARAVGAAVLPAGDAEIDLQVAAARDVGSTVYAGRPEFLKTLLERADALGVTLDITRAVVAGDALYPGLRRFYRDHGIIARQSYVRPDTGLLAYESEAMEGMIVNEDIIVEIIQPDSDQPTAQGEIGEVVITALNPDYPLIRYATGDLSAIMPGISPCGRTNTRIRGRLGSVDETATVNGIVLHPGQIAKLLARQPEIDHIRVVVEQGNGVDIVRVQLETAAPDAAAYAEAVTGALRMNAMIEVVAPGTLPQDAHIIDDRRNTDPPHEG